MDVEALKRKRAEALAAWHTVDEYQFKIRRPTQIEAMRLVSAIGEHGEAGLDNVIDAIELCAAFVDDWKGITESDIVDGGNKKPVPFDRELLGMFLEDHVSVGDGITGLVFDKVKDRQSKAAEEKKH